jgi:hypothetical protein
MGEETRTWHQKFAVALFNQCWELIDRDARDSDDNVEMLLLAATSRWHWAQVGGPEQIAAGDWQVAHVASLLGLVDLALIFAERNIALATGEGWHGWRLASAHEGMARACSAAGDAEGRRRHLERGREALERENDAESRTAIAEQLDSVPEAAARRPAARTASSSPDERS